MKHFISLLIIALLLASCGTSNSFSKRKHLSGHFWKKSGGHGNPKERKLEKSLLSDSETDNPSLANSSKEIQAEQEQQLQSQVENSDDVDLSLDVPQIENKTQDEGSNNHKEASISEDNSTTSHTFKKENEELGVLYFAYIALIVLLSLGVLFILIWLVFKILAIVATWLLFTGLIILGAALLCYLGVMIWLLAIT